MGAPVHDEEFFREQVSDTYRASARMREYSAWSAGFGVLLAVGVVGAMLIGWMDASDGFTWLGFALLTGIVAAARFFADATRTIVNAAMLERQLDVDEAQPWAEALAVKDGRFLARSMWRSLRSPTATCGTPSTLRTWTCW